MLTYNTRLKKLVLPEYGRNLQKMVDHCVELEDREERNRCARSIIRSMETLFPELKQPENAHKVWDHLAIMSDFKLDIDYPEGVVKPDDLKTIPNRVPYSGEEIHFRAYGKIIEQMIRKAAAMPEGEERDRVAIMIANHMKKQMLAINPDGVEDSRIFIDLANYSDGAIRLDSATTRLEEFQIPVKPAQGKKKRKRK